MGKIRWLRNDQPFLKVDRDDLQEFIINDQPSRGPKIKVLDSGARLVVENVDESLMANYTIIAQNSLGEGHFGFFLNVTHGPRLVGSALENVTAEGSIAELQCKVRANPIPNFSAVRWKRLSRGISNSYINGNVRTSTNQEAPAVSDDGSITGIRCGTSEWKGGFKYYASCVRNREGDLESTLYIYQLNREDVGRYQCLVDNGIGSPAIKSIDLIFPSEPRYLPLSRWQTSAPKKVPPGFQDKLTNNNALVAGPSVLTCVFMCEPDPKVVWTREPTNQTLMEGGQLTSKVDRIKTGIYMATLTFKEVRPADLGRYYCKVSLNK
ncbi:hypothetical protein Ciccas_006387 [Cichlidogyrus casuarinus]|uniref:Ig-like domain-containing protein n=1 Tax=Cichlidogyrus casuarinus TaxID=1844966 RepID=A0ABD2Q624_9PLAT